MNTDVRARRRATAIALAAVTAALFAPQAASASTASVVNGTIVYAGGSEANAVTVSYGAGTYQIDDSGAPSLTAGAGCTVQAQRFRCPATGVSSFDISLGGGDDSVLNFTLTPAKVAGGAGADTITSGGGNDTVDAGADNDTVYGGWGDDSFVADAGADTYDGNVGTDSIDYSARTAPLNVTPGTGADDGEAGEGDTVGAVERVTGGAGDDALTGSAAAERLAGGPGADVLVGGDGADELDGGPGVDSFDGGAGADVLRAQDGVAETGACGPDADTFAIDAIDVLASDCEGYTPGVTDTVVDDASGSGTGAGPGTGGGATSGGGTVFDSPIAVTIPAAPAPWDVRRGTVAVSLTCPSGLAGGCTGTITLVLIESGSKTRVVASRRRRMTKLGSKRFKLAAGAQKPVPVQLSRRGRRSLAKRRRAKIEVTVAMATPAGTAVTTRTLTLQRRNAGRVKTKKPKKPSRGRR